MALELGNFNDTGNGHFKAAFGHDDLVMASVQLEFVKETLQYTLLKNDFDVIQDTDQSSNELIWNPYDDIEEDYHMQNYKRLGGYLIQ